MRSSGRRGEPDRLVAASLPGVLMSLLLIVGLAAGYAAIIAVNIAWLVITARQDPVPVSRPRS